MMAAGAGRAGGDAPWAGRQLHFVGIGGAGMSALALIAHALGARVSGSDRGESSYTRRLREHGIAPLRGCGLDPAYALGGELRAAGLNGAWGSGEWIVVEADESHRSLLRLTPRIALLTNLELDHHSTYASRLDLERTVASFMARAQQRAVVWDRPQ